MKRTIRWEVVYCGSWNRKTSMVEATSKVAALESAQRIFKCSKRDASKITLKAVAF